MEDWKDSEGKSEKRERETVCSVVHWFELN